MAGADRMVRHGVLAFGRLMGELGLGGVDSVHVHVRGQPSVEQHWTPDVRRDVFSVSKTFVSMAVGIAEAEGLLAVSDPILSHLDHLVPDAAAGVELISDPVDTMGHQATGASGPHPENARYGHHVWLCARDEAWRMDGIYGQFGVVLPRQQACITVAAHYRGPTTDILDGIWSHIVPGLR